MSLKYTIVAMALHNYGNNPATVSCLFPFKCRSGESPAQPCYNMIPLQLKDTGDSHRDERKGEWRKCVRQRPTKNRKKKKKGERIYLRKQDA